jgi:uncharacterized protein (DUF1697 family)
VNKIAVNHYAGFLRGINVGGHRVTSDQIRSCIEGLGFGDVATFRASGNVIFTDEAKEPPMAVAGKLEKGLAESLGYEVPVFLRTATEVEAIARRDPFPAKLLKASAGKLQVMLLPKKPAARAKQSVLALATDDDRLAFGERELFWLPSGGMMDSDLDLKGIEALIGPTTTRTKGTIDQIAARYF